LLKIGGNTKFDNFITPYNFALPEDKTIQEVVYGSVACNYWREKLNIQLCGISLELDPPSKEDGV
jgi:hypothetical protein